MIDYVKHINEINDKKQDIAKAISLAFSNGDLDKARNYYKVFKDQIEDAKIFISEVRNFNNDYENEIFKLLDDVKEIVGYDLKRYVLAKNRGTSSVAVFSGANCNFNNKELEKLYNQNENLFDKFSISSFRVLDIYEKKGIEEIYKLTDLLKKVSKKMRFYNEKSFFSTMKSVMKFGHINDKYLDLCKKYKLNNVTELLDLNTEIDSFLVNEKNLSNQEREIVLKNRKKFIERVNEEDDFFLGKEEAMKLKSQIKEICDFTIYRNVFKETNFGEFFKMYDVKQSKNSLRDVFSSFFHHFSCSACCSTFEYDDGKHSTCLFSSEILNEGNEEQKNIVLHELIHSLEDVERKQNSFCVNHRYMNEAITEHLAKKSLKYFDGDILSARGENKKYFVIYDNMIPLVERLEKSSIWEDVLKCKLSGDSNILIKKIGVINLIKISSCFDNCFVSSKEKNIEKNLKKLDGILNKIEIKTAKK